MIHVTYKSFLPLLLMLFNSSAASRGWRIFGASSDSSKVFLCFFTSSACKRNTSSSKNLRVVGQAHISSSALFPSRTPASILTPSSIKKKVESPLYRKSVTGGRIILFDAAGEQSESEEHSNPTGWLHNQPQKRPNENETIDRQQNKDTLRTGWLHRTESRSVEESRIREKQLQQKEQLKKQQENYSTSSDSPLSSSSLSEIAKRLQNNMSKQQRNHRIITPPTLYPSGEEGRTIVITEHKISVPLQRDFSTVDDDITPETLRSDAQRIDVFFKVVDLIPSDNFTKEKEFFLSLTRMSPNDRATQYVQHYDLKDMAKGIVYLQGGPGFGAPAPISGIGLTSKSSWAGAALSNGFNKIVLMDQRGTGRSTPITKQTLQKRFPELFALDNILEEEIVNHSNVSDLIALLKTHDSVGLERVNEFQTTVEGAVTYMSHFRADNIVHDAEEIKTSLMMPSTSKDPRPWGAALGQSFGGFCMMTYLSLIPHPPTICLLTGGIAPMLTPVEEVYKSLWGRVKERNLLYYKRYPGDVPVVKRIVKQLLDRPERLPSGGMLTARRFLQYGMSLGGSPSSFASMHNVFATAFLDEENEGFGVSSGDNNDFSKAFLKYMDSAQPFDDNPIYFLLHESIYADGPDRSPTKWAANKVTEDLMGLPTSEYNYKLVAASNDDKDPVLLSGEMVFPWMADGDYIECSGLGMKALAHGLAHKEDWTPLYNPDKMRKALAGGSVAAAAAVYTDDMYVDYDACRKVTQVGGPLEDCKLYITNEYQHSGLRDDGATIFSKLLSMAQGSIGVPS